MDTQNFHSSEQESHLDDIVNVLEPVTKNVRFLNYILDIIVVYFLMFLVGVVLAVTGNSDLISNTIVIRLFAIIVFFFYYFLMENTAGRTIGKLITGTKVVTQDGDKPTTKQIALRSLSRIVPFEPFSKLRHPAAP